MSLIVAPVADGRIGTASLFDVDEHATPALLALDSVEHLSGGLFWLHYRIANT